jgi:hypothetical protein
LAAFLRGQFREKAGLEDDQGGLVWDPAGRTLIAANLRGTMPWTEDAATPDT